MGPKKLPKVQKDHYARASFLFQAANFHLMHGNPELSRMMARGVDLVSKRAVLRLLPHLKRSICKKCKNVLVAGLTMTQSIENLLKNAPHADILVRTCMVCNTAKRFPIGKDPEYQLHCDKNLVS